MSLNDLASLLNSEARSGRAFISESEIDVSIAKLSADLTLRLIKLCKTAGVVCLAYDDEYSHCDEEDIHDDMGQFRLTITKPERPAEDADLYILTASGFSDFLRKGNESNVWRITGLESSFRCQARVFGNWEEPITAPEVAPTKSPRMLVKEATDTRIVPEDIRPYLLYESTLNPADPLHGIWVSHAFDSLIRCIANEVSASDRRLIFKGPPKLSLEYHDRDHGTDDVLAFKDFQGLQDAAVWVYENAREAEMKYVLLSTEIARSGRSDGEVITYFRENLESALDCAKIAYQMAISEVTKDTLKSLGDLRKAVTEETSKATDATRQTVTAITTAAGVGIGLAVARMSIAINPWVILLVMIMVWLYVASIAYSGWHFILGQRELRKQWQTKLYRFLSSNDYKNMVIDPVNRAETLFKLTAIWGVCVLAVWALGVVLFAFYTIPFNAKLPAERKVIQPAETYEQPRRHVPREPRAGYEYPYLIHTQDSMPSYPES
ncbi:hypothetical protein D7241_06625 [Stutzerimonas sp. VN223-3]|uniref:hypothetical protein n=1 Tax=Stutzerimonas sp. VN223-3 TaxID=3384601 RepID=UPI0038B510EF